MADNQSPKIFFIVRNMNLRQEIFEDAYRKLTIKTLGKQKRKNYMQL